MHGMILITGGCGYIGSHTCIALAEAGYLPIILDNLSNSHPTVIDQLEKIIGLRPILIEGDVRDVPLLKQIFVQYPIKAVMHFAALKAVADSVIKPLNYYDNNVKGTIHLLQAMAEAKVKTMVFSSSATVYGDIPTIPYQEHHARSPFNPYGRCKMIVEDILADLYSAEPDWRIASLRYFNPVGAHSSGLIGEDPKGIPSNLMPFLAQVAAGQYPKLNIFGNDYPTTDGTCIRDYIHVMDLAAGHVAALNYLAKKPELLTVNLGTGQGTSVLEMVHAFEAVTGCKIPYRFVNRRPGDLAAYWADAGKAKQTLNWNAKLTPHQMCEDTWRWQKNHSLLHSGNSL